MIFAKCMLENLSSEKVMLRSGMTFVEIRRGAIVKDGKSWDAKVYSIKRGENYGKNQ
jgi:RimJ/RimL family protein N-acetyltransferase